MADMEEREETYLKLFYNRHPGLGAIEPVLCHLPGQPGILIVFWKQSVTAEWGLSPHTSSQSSSSLSRDYSRKCLYWELGLCFTKTRQVPQISYYSNDASCQVICSHYCQVLLSNCLLMMPSPLASCCKILICSHWRVLKNVRLEHFLESELKVIWTRIIVGGWEWLCNDASRWTKNRALNLLRGWLEKCSIKFPPQHRNSKLYSCHIE